MSKSNRLREDLAAYAHDAWSEWMKHLFKSSFSNQQASTEVIDAEHANRWKRQMGTLYVDLPEDEKESDRHEADRIIRIVRDHYHQVDTFPKPVTTGRRPISQCPWCGKEAGRITQFAMGQQPLHYWRCASCEMDWISLTRSSTNE